MFDRTSHLHNAFREKRVEVHHPVHAAGILPNDMNRFLQSNAQKVLFVI
jgi:hypothetical protein